MSSWQTDSSKVVYETPWISVRRDEVRNHKGKKLTYSVLVLPHPSVFIVAVNADCQILIQREYRYTIDREIWSVPAGHSDGDDPLAAGKRELLEETGMISADWTDLGLFYQATGIADVPYHALLARNVRQQTNERDEDEEILEQRFVSLDEIERMIVKGEFYDAPALAAVYAAKIHGI